MATKRQSYTTSEKLKIIQFAEEHGILDGSEDDFIFDTSSDDESIVADDSLVSESDFEGF